MIRRISSKSFGGKARTIGVPNEQEEALARAFRSLADKVQDQKHVGGNPIQVWAQIFSEVAEELEHGYGKDKG